MSLSDALQSSYRAFMDGLELKGAFLDGVERSWGQVEVARNLFTNPNLVGDGTYATVAENLFTNPNLVGDGTWAEVRRNYITNPRVRLSSQWGGQLGTTTVPSELNGRSAGLVTRGGNVSAATISLPASSRGKKLYVRLVVAATASTVNTLVNSFLYAGGVLPAAGVTSVVLGGVGEEKVLEYALVDPSPNTGGIFYLNMQSQAPGDQVHITDVEVSDTPFTGPYMDGSTTPETAVGVDQPEDFRWRWLGAENASESVMEIEHVAGFTDTRCIAGVSTKAGKPAARLISKGADSDTYTRMVIPPGLPTGVAVLGTSHLDGPIEGSGVKRGTINAGNGPFIQLPAVPNQAGMYPLRLRNSGESLTYAQFGHGGAQGSGDVWWTDIGLFAGNYTGNAFSGDTAPEDVEGLVQPEDFRTRWSGAVNNSSSVMEIERVRGLTASSSIAGVSTWEGKAAVRLIPLGTQSSGAPLAHFPIPADARASGTLMGTLHIRNELTGTFPAATRMVGAASPFQGTGPSPTTPGTYARRLNYADLTSTYLAYIYAGARLGGGDVWWTDIGLVAGEYDGPAFSGDTPDYGRDTYTWAGERNNSPSIHRRYE